MESFDPLYIWSFGHVTLHLPRDFFHHYTLQEFFALRDRHFEQEDYWPAQLVALTANIHRGKDAQPIDPQALMRIKRPAPTKKSLVNPDLKTKLRLFADAHNAFVKQKSVKKVRRP